MYVLHTDTVGVQVGVPQGAPFILCHEVAMLRDPLPRAQSTPCGPCAEASSMLEARDDLTWIMRQDFNIQRWFKCLGAPSRLRLGSVHILSSPELGT